LFVQNRHQAMWKGVLLLTGLLLLLGSGCGGGNGSKGDFAAGTRMPTGVANKRPEPIWTRH
jgi:hypothetical protein